MVKVYNTLTREKEELIPINDKKINMFVCGPTVYDFSHIGHAKTYVQFDVICKYLRYRGFDVFYLQNITDIDDKIIKRANEQGISSKELAEKFEAEYIKDMTSLNVNSVNEYARATEHMPQIIKQIKDLIEKGHAYETEDGIYFEIDSFDEYGKLSNQPLDQIKEGARISVNEHKKDPSDFSLWKKRKPDEPFWESPWGEGRPGWHIEDTAITEEYFGPQYDLHGGAVDLIFPHHECEIAQMESASGKKPLVKYWLHTAFLNIGKEKMAKSAGNFITIREALKKWDAKVYRYFYAQTHYRSPIEYSEENIDHAKAALERINEFIRKAKHAAGNDDSEIVKNIENTKKKFIEHMDNDFDMPQAIACVYEFIRETNKKDFSQENGVQILKFLEDIDEILGVMTFDEEIPHEVLQLAQERQKFRDEKNWSESDRIRDELKEKGFYVDDTPNGPVVKRI